MGIEKEDIEKVVDIGYMVCIKTNSTAFKEGYVYKVKIAVKDSCREPYFSVLVELDSDGSKTNGHTSKFFRLATQAEAEVYGIIKQPYHISQVEILLGVDINDRDQVLIAAAKLRGFVEGAKFKDLDREFSYEINTMTSKVYTYYENNDDLYVDKILPINIRKKKRVKVEALRSPKTKDFVERIMDYLKGGEKAKLAKFQKGVVKYLDMQLSVDNILIYRQGKWTEIIEEALKKKTVSLQGKEVSVPGKYSLKKSGLKSTVRGLNKIAFWVDYKGKVDKILPINIRKKKRVKVEALRSPKIKE